ncbi:hypothetical protein ACFV7Q_10935 [Streptomyces sp. NPDC059851]|uniref:hypothetical protein n=1 Tax=Streptomyces sp. NPDC059851 TaxID=3346971 RepID=UPI0036487A4A
MPLPRYVLAATDLTGDNFCWQFTRDGLFLDCHEDFGQETFVRGGEAGRVARDPAAVRRGGVGLAAVLPPSAPRLREETALRPGLRGSSCCRAVAGASCGRSASVRPDRG